MTKKTDKNELAKVSLPGHKLFTSKAYQNAVGVSDIDYQQHKLSEISKLLWFHGNATREEIQKHIVRALELYESLKPADGAEGMLAMQMVGTHDAALECLRRAAIPNQAFESRDLNLKHAQKLMALYTQQIAALNKHRGKGQQKVTVEHVNVAPGGQAIVGNIETGNKASDAPQTSIEHQAEITIEKALPEELVKTPRMRK